MWPRATIAGAITPHAPRDHQVEGNQRTRRTAMSIKNIIRAWKDEDYRLSLSEAERALLPEHPAGLIELSGAEMDGVNGGVRTFVASTARYCRGHPNLACGSPSASATSPRGEDVTQPCRGHRPLTPPPAGRWGEGWCSTLRNRGGPPPGCRPREVIVPGDSGPAARAAAPPLPTWPAAPGGIRRPDCAGAGPLMNPAAGDGPCRPARRE